ncbi:ScyD/ScyE family protein [Kribbella sp. NPDC048915]|uniref:ScyD/ScyE family protein n=1 Tax=Kribbella sp. NPDC048915 TaxID=3155148 RepID=UPI0033D4D79B
MGARTRLAAVAALALTASALVTTQADAHGKQHSSLKPVASKLNGPRGVSTYKNLVIYSVTDGSVYATTGRKTVKLGQVPGGFPPAIDTNKWGTTYALTGAGGEPGQPLPPGSATLYRLRPGKSPVKVADIAKYQAKDPDPFNLADSPTESNPFGVAALNDGTVLVADAANNDLLRVWPNGHIKTVARLKPRVVKVPTGIPPSFGLPPAGSRMPSEAVATSVTVGSDGYWYVGELRGAPATPGTSQIWRIKPGSVGAVCDPVRPYKGKCQRYADGYTSLVDLAGGPRGVLSVVELDKASWLKMEINGPTKGGLFLQYPGKHHKAGFKRELVRNQLVQPGGTAFDRWGGLYVSAPVFGTGAVYKVRY